MIRRDVLTDHSEDSGDARREWAARIELDSADLEEPTWEMRSPRKRRFDRRSRTILALAAAAALLANAGAAWAYWHLTQPAAPAATAREPVPVPVDIVLHGHNDLNHALRPGATGDLTVTVSNDKSVPIRITSIAVGHGGVVTDPEHRSQGCTRPGVRVSRTSFPVSWEVARNTVGAFTLSRALTMDRDTPIACSGATFTVPLRARGVQR